MAALTTSSAVGSVSEARAALHSQQIRPTIPINQTRSPESSCSFNCRPVWWEGSSPRRTAAISPACFPTTVRNRGGRRRRLLVRLGSSQRNSCHQRESGKTSTRSSLNATVRPRTRRSKPAASVRVRPQPALQWHRRAQLRCSGRAAVAVDPLGAPNAKRGPLRTSSSGRRRRDPRARASDPARGRPGLPVAQRRARRLA